MLLSSKFKKSLFRLFCCFFVLSAVFAPNKSYAIYDGIRSMSYDTDSHKCSNDDYATSKFDPIMINFKTSEFEMTNPVCIGIMSGFGAAMLSTYTFANTVACVPLNPAGAAKQTQENAAAWFPPPLPFPNPFVPAQNAATIGRCASRIAESGAYSGFCAGGFLPACALAATAAADAGRCCAATPIYISSVVALQAALLVIWDKSKTTYNKARVCGHNWNQWTTNSEGLHAKEVGPYPLCLRQLFVGDASPDSECQDILGYSDVSSARGASLTNKLENKFYREYIYGGIEFVDKSDDACSNPWKDEKSYRKKYLGYESDEQKYYMTGSGSAPVFACYRFLSQGINADTQKAYDCCKKKSQTNICIENKTGLGSVLGEYEHRFCKIGSFCTVADTEFEAYASVEEANYVCAKTRSLCPYNHLLGGGTEKKKISSDISNGTQVENYCQFMNHCSKLPLLPYVYSSNLQGAFISGACKDLKGDSQNVYGYTSQLVPINTRNFTAPMVQCFKETMENIFLNKAGSTKCENAAEQPDVDGVCPSGTYIYKKGDSMDEIHGASFFVRIQSKLREIIKLGLVISVVVFGYKILIGVPKVDSFNKKSLLTYIVKIAIVMYFAIGTGWQDGFLNGVLGFSGAMSELALHIEESTDESKLDGCQFPRFNYADSNEDTKYDNPAYAPNNRYLRIWDTLDCKMARALGYGPEVSVPNLIFMILGGFLDFGAGVIFVVASLSMGFLMIMIAVRSLHIFLLSTTAVILLMYVSPITITCAMFDRTKNIFSSWWKQILGLSLQPMILFAYLGVFIAVFDNAIVGDATFEGDGKTVPKRIMCHNNSVGEALMPINGVSVESFDSINITAIDDNSENTSIYCIFRFAAIDTLHGLESLGIALPALASMTQEKMATITKAALLMFIFLQFLDKISGFATELVGGAELKSDWASAAKMTGRAMAALRGISARGRRAISKHGSKIARGGAAAITSGANAIGKKGAAAFASKSGGSKGQGADQSRSSKLNNVSRGSDKSGDSVKNSNTSADGSAKNKSNSKAPEQNKGQDDYNPKKALADESTSSASNAAGEQSAKAGSSGDNSVSNKQSSDSNHASKSGDGSGKV